MKTVSIREANRDLSKLIQDLERKGEGYIITRRGRPVAQLVPHVDDKRDDPEWQAAFRQMQRLHTKGLDLGGLKIDRDDLYER